MEQNPTKVHFECPDHDMCTGHEIDFLNDQDQVVDTIEAGVGILDPTTGVVTIEINLLPKTPGKYTTAVRATVGDEIESATSDKSAVWHRGPRAPINVQVSG